MRKVTERTASNTDKTPEERLRYYEDLLGRHERAVQRIRRKIAELENSREWKILMILEDERTSQMGISLCHCTTLLGRVCPHTGEERCRKALESLIEQGLVRRRTDKPTLFVLNSRCPEWVDSPDPTGIGPAFLLDNGAVHHPELDVAFQK